MAHASGDANNMHPLTWGGINGNDLACITRTEQTHTKFHRLFIIKLVFQK